MNFNHKLLFNLAGLKSFDDFKNSRTDYWLSVYFNKETYFFELNKNQQFTNNETYKFTNITNVNKISQLPNIPK